jgi:hypothetical protein
MAFSTERILTNNLNIGFNVMTCLSFKDRYNLCLTSKSLFETLFKKYQHNEIIEIQFEDYRLCDIWSNVKFKIILNYSNITNVSMLGNVHTLDLYWCRNITDVSMLGKVHTLNLFACSNITDVSMLGNVHTLNLSYCSKITDVSMLGEVHTLNLSCCKNIPEYQIKKLEKTVKNLKY